MRALSNYDFSTTNNKIKLNGEKIKNQKLFINEISNKLSFPTRNCEDLDSLYDMLTDLSWLGNTNEITIIYTNSDKFKNENLNDFEESIETLIRASEYWNGSKFKLNVIIG